jgi:Carboxypeptidase regulatory-like domain
MLRCLKAFAILGSLVVFPAAAYAQASIVGTVRDASGGVVPGTTVEASSPVLIEKTRSVVSSATGQYAIEDLRPGIYTVTFSLTGFSTVVRSGIELTGRFVATVNAEMKVGSLSETVTVTGETPVIDVSTALNEQTISGQTVADIPSSRQYSAFTQLVPAVNVQGNDVGGSSPGLYSVFQIHGGRRNEGQVQLDGMSAGYQGMGVSGYVPEVGNSQEVVFSLTGGLGEATTGGPQMNIVGKQGGNMFAGSFFINGTGSGLQGSNLTEEIKAEGLTATNSFKQVWDVNPSFGGPIVRDKLWFFATYRYQYNDQYVASMWVNKNAGDPTKWTYDPDLSQQAINDGRWRNTSARVTWQATPRNKINAWSGIQYSCLPCEQGGDAAGLGFGALIRSPEGYTRGENHPSWLTQVSWTSPVTSRLLLEANTQLGPYFWWGARQKNSFDKTFIPVQDDAGSIPGINYRAAPWSGHTGYTNIVQGSASYVTGSHSAKFGGRFMMNDSTFPKNFYNDSQLKYFFQNGVPYQLTMYADQASQQHQQQSLFALFAQDRWTLGRLSLQGGLRFEHLSDHFPEQQIGPNIFMPTAAVFPDQDGPLNQKELLPRFGASYDVFGNGRTAAKFFLGRYVTTFNTVDEWANYSPAGLGHFVGETNRPWTDANGDFVANCDLLNPAGNGECGPMANPAFGKQVNNLTVDPATISGWNTREYSWDLTAGVTQQVAPRISVEVAYIRRSWGNLQATINRALTPADFDSFVYNVPQDSLLPGGGGYALTFYDVKPAKFGQFDNFLTFADNVGGAFNRFNGVDFTVNARLPDLTVQGGFSTGNVVEDSCGVAANHPEFYIFTPWGGTDGFLDTFLGGLGQWPQAFCHRESGWQTNLKGLATYNVPKIDMLISGTFRSLPYPGNEFPNVATQSLGGQALLLFAETSLGRPFAGGNIPVQFFNIVEPGAMYGDRLNNVDLRFGKNLRYGRTRTLIALDIFNVTNSNTTDVYQRAYSPTLLRPGAQFLNPLSITQARLFKISAQIDF